MLTAVSPGPLFGQPATPLMSFLENPSEWRVVSNAGQARGLWSEEEHNRFLDALKLYPRGPWKAITAHVGTRSIRQVQTHAQKYQEKIQRRARGLKTTHPRLLRQDHRIDDEIEPWWMRNNQSETSPKQQLPRRDSTCSPTASGSLGTSKVDSRVSVHTKPQTRPAPASYEYDPLPFAVSTDRLAMPEPALSKLPSLEECIAVLDECLAVNEDHSESVII